MTSHLAGLSLALLLSLPLSASAQALTSDAEARMHFEMGRRYYESGRFTESATEFERAYELTPLPDLLYNLFLSYRDAGDDVHAADALRRFVATLPEGEERRAVLEARLRTLDERIAASAAAASAAETEAPEATDPPEEGPPDEPPPTVERSHDLAVVGGVLTGVGAALGIAAVGTGVAALDQRAALAASCPMSACAPGFESAQSNGQALAITTDALWVSGSVVAITGLALLIADLAAPSESGPSAAAACTHDGCIAWIGGRL